MTATASTSERRERPLRIGEVVRRLSERVPRHLDLEGPISRGRGPRHAAADPGRLPAVQRRRCRALADRAPSAARRVPAAPRDSRGARSARAEGTEAEEARGARRRGGDDHVRRALRARTDHRRARTRARRVRAAPAARHRRRKRYPEDDADVAATCARLQRFGVRRATCGRSGRLRDGRRRCSTSWSRPRSAPAASSGGRRGCASSSSSPSWSASCRRCSSGATCETSRSEDTSTSGRRSVRFRTSRRRGSDSRT